MTKITKSDLERAKKDVMQQDADDAKFVTFMAANRAWSSFLKNAYKNEFEKLVDDHLGNAGDTADQELKANEYAVAEHERKLELTREWLDRHPRDDARQRILGKRLDMESPTSPDALRTSLIERSGRLRDGEIRTLPVARHAQLIGQAQRQSTVGMPLQEQPAVLGFPGGSVRADALPGTDPALAVQWLKDKLKALPNGILIRLNPDDLIIPDDYHQAEVLGIDEKARQGRANPEDNMIRLRVLGPQGDPPLDVTITLAQLLKAWLQRDGYRAVPNQRR